MGHMPEAARKCVSPALGEACSLIIEALSDLLFNFVTGRTSPIGL